MGTGDSMHDAALCPRNKNNGNKQRLLDFPFVKPASCRCSAAVKLAHLIASIKDDTFAAARSSMMIVIMHIDTKYNSPICACTSCCSQHTRPWASTSGCMAQPLCEMGGSWYLNMICQQRVTVCPAACSNGRCGLRQQLRRHPLKRAIVNATHQLGSGSSWAHHTCAKQCSMLASSNLFRHQHVTSKKQNQSEDGKSAGEDAEVGTAHAGCSPTAADGHVMRSASLRGSCE